MLKYGNDITDLIDRADRIEAVIFLNGEVYSDITHQECCRQIKENFFEKYGSVDISVDYK